MAKWQDLVTALQVLKRGKSYLCSHMLGIHPSHQDKGVGSQLKQEQKKIAKEMGYDLIVWTYDPLETKNGYLNLSKLHTICSTYVENCYGEMEGSLNRGLPSDRFKVEWWINSPHVEKQHRFKQDQDDIVIQWDALKNDLPKLLNIEKRLKTLHHKDQSILVPVPADFQRLKNVNNDLAFDWRLKTREIFQSLFSIGYAVVSLIKSEDEPVHYYKLVKRNKLDIN
ncbi:GNAT family N-acetyltransferase [Bacillus canaveralius]|uniref:GNAT family N-acetyltransferase n=1 Tax=Bacillus canaveralius TaxID=1403243 RepID=UPI0027E3E608|nr:GNAT family N-acetyltransferase [Bacillus canaveralius]